MRINPDGSVPEDNPFVGQDGALPEIWSYGHRNIQAAAINPESGVLWEIEHGPMGGDELNIPEAGKNYGWPVVSFGVNYSGTPVGVGRERRARLRGSDLSVDAGHRALRHGLLLAAMRFPEWQGDLFVGGLASTALVRLELDGNTVTHEERILDDAGLRIRDVRGGTGRRALSGDRRGQRSRSCGSAPASASASD